MERVLRSTLILVLVGLLTGVATAETYVVSPKASDEVREAVNEGRPPVHGFPEIHKVEFSGPSRLHPGSHLRAVVTTSENVGYVEGRVKYWNVPFQRVGPGRFDVDYKVPLLPPGALGHWNLQVIARSVDGVEIKRNFPMTYAYF